MVRDDQSSNAQRLVYRDRSHPFIGIPLFVLGLLAIVYFGFALMQNLPRDFRLWGGRGILPLLCSLLFSFVIVGLLLSLGVTLLKSRRLVFENALRQVTVSSRFLFWQHSTTHDYAEFNTVSWKPRRRRNTEGSGATLYPITLSGPQKWLQLFEETDMEDARNVTCEVGEFLGLGQNHWSIQLTTPGSAEFTTHAKHSAMAKRRMSLIGGGATWRVRRSDTSLIYMQTFEPFVKWITAIFTVAGACTVISALFDASTLLGALTEEGGKLWIGVVFFILGAAVLSGRRGVTIDAENNEAFTWIGLIVPIWTKRHDLSSCRSVGFEQHVEEANTTPCVVCRVFLIGDHDQRIILFKSLSSGQIRPFAHDVAEFLKVPFISDDRSAAARLPEAFNFDPEK